jgi:hypothetical protein
MMKMFEMAGYPPNAIEVERASPRPRRGDHCAPAGGHASASASCVNAMYQRLRQIEVERVKVLNEVHNLSRSEDLDKLHTAVRRFAALERYSQRSHSKLISDSFERAGRCSQYAASEEQTRMFGK